MQENLLAFLRRHALRVLDVALRLVSAPRRFASAVLSGSYSLRDAAIFYVVGVLVALALETPLLPSNDDLTRELVGRSAIFLVYGVGLAVVVWLSWRLFARQASIKSLAAVALFYAGPTLVANRLAVFSIAAGNQAGDFTFIAVGIGLFVIPFFYAAALWSGIRSHYAVATWRAFAAGVMLVLVHWPFSHTVLAPQIVKYANAAYEAAVDASAG